MMTYAAFLLCLLAGDLQRSDNFAERGGRTARGVRR